MSSVQYEYLVRRKRDGELFVALGNFKAGWTVQSIFINLWAKIIHMEFLLHWGKRKNISVDGISLEDGGYKVIRQAAQ